MWRLVGMTISTFFLIILIFFNYVNEVINLCIILIELTYVSAV